MGKESLEEEGNPAPSMDPDDLDDDMDLDALLGELEAVQESTSQRCLSERNIIEIIMKLTKAPPKETKALQTNRQELFLVA